MRVEHLQRVILPTEIKNQGGLVGFQRYLKAKNLDNLETTLPPIATLTTLTDESIRGFANGAQISLSEKGYRVGAFFPQDTIGHVSDFIPELHAGDPVDLEVKLKQIRDAIEDRSTKEQIRNEINSENEIDNIGVYVLAGRKFNKSESRTTFVQSYMQRNAFCGVSQNGFGSPDLMGIYDDNKDQRYTPAAYINCLPIIKKLVSDMPANLAFSVSMNPDYQIERLKFVACTEADCGYSF